MTALLNAETPAASASNAAGTLGATLMLGSPRFTDPMLAELARTQGVPAAWKAAFGRDRQRGASHVQGDFAVSLKDAAGRHWLAVDRFAVQTLCYRIVNGQLHVAERADALAQAGGVTAEIDSQALFDYLYFHAIPSPRTVFKGVFRLPAGHTARFEHGQLTLSTHWVPEFREGGPAASFDELKHEFRNLLREAVGSRLDSGTHGCFLSGGTDSSTVAGMIREATGQPASTYSIGFEAEGYDEMAFARIAAKAFDTQHHEYYVTPADLVASIGDVARHYDQPFGNSSALPVFYCARMARDDGVTRLLAGDGGDELFGGNTRYAKQRVFGWYGRLPEGVRSGALEPFFMSPAVSQMPLLKKGSSYIEQAKLPMPERLQMYNLLLRLGVKDVLTSHFLSQVDTTSPVRQQRAVWDLARTGSAVNRTLAYDWRYTLAESDLPKVRGTTQLAGVDVAFPLLDDALLAFSLGLPVDYKLRGLKLRWFFKEALRGFLPDEILTKKKQGFGLPFGVWLTKNAALKRLAADSLGSLATRGIVRPDFIGTLIEHRLPEHPGYYGEMVWILMMLEQWLQGHAPNHRL